jgi:hypothetical protein
LEGGARTADIARAEEPVLGTREMGERIADAVLAGAAAGKATT